MRLAQHACGKENGHAEHFRMALGACSGYSAGRLFESRFAGRLAAVILVGIDLDVILFVVVLFVVVFILGFFIAV